MVKGFFVCIFAAAVAFSSLCCVEASVEKSLTLAKDGKAGAVIVKTSDANAAAVRLNQLFQKELGVTLAVASISEATAAKQLKIVLCTVASFPELTGCKAIDIAKVKISPEGFMIKTDAADGGSIFVIGADKAGLRYGVGELWNYYVKIDGKTATVGSPLSVKDSPVFSKRILWNWDFITNWDEDLALIHQTAGIDPGGKLRPYLEQPDGYEKQFGRVIDFASDHKLNGLIIYGFISDQHGGIESAQRLSKHAKANSVRILPGVGTVIYGGFYYIGSNNYNLPHWLSQHPEVRPFIGEDGKPVAGVPCPSDPELAKFLVEGSKWFFNTFNDIGGVNIEHGDFFQCYCDLCKAERAKPENDQNFLWDMMHTQVPVVETGHAINPDLWFTYSPYWGYNKDMMANPPKFLKQYPDYSIVQWTYTGMMMDPNNWPADLKAPAGAQHSIGLLHQGSYWHTPSTWWASPGASYALIAELIQRTCKRANQDGSEGLEIVGHYGPASPQNELNYLAFEAFTWNPNLTLDQWFDNKLPNIYGSSALARQYYSLLSSATTDSEQLQKDINTAKEVAQKLTDARQAKRWNSLVRELSRRHALAAKGLAKPFGPGPLEGVEDVTIQF